MALLEVDEVAGHDREAGHFAQPQVPHLDPRPEADPVGWHVRDVDLRDLGHAPGQVPNPRLHELLALERALVLGVFTQISQLDRLTDALRQDHVEFVGEGVDLFGDPGLDFVEHGPEPRWGRGRMTGH